MIRLRDIRDQMGLTPAEWQHVMDSLSIQDVRKFGHRSKFIEWDGRNVVSTGVGEKLVDAYAGKDVRLVYIDPTSMLGPVESGGNDGLSALMLVGGVICEGLEAGLAYVHHTSQQVAREGIYDVHAGRGGTAFGDNARWHRQLTRLKERSIRIDGLDWFAPPSIRQDDIDARRVLVLMYHKHSYAPPHQAPFFLIRTGFGFRYEIGLAATNPAVVQSVANAKAQQERDEIDGLTSLVLDMERAGEYPSQNMIETAAKTRLGFSKDKTRDYVQRLFPEVPLPPGVKKVGRTTYRTATSCYDAMGNNLDSTDVLF